jgi:type IV pilus assembly protein PilV
MKTNMRNRTMAGPRAPKSQQGVMLLEALVAILIFTLGVIAVMGMQAVSIQQVSQAKYRIDASYLADQIIGKMWVDQAIPANLAGYASAGGPGRATWDTLVADSLPSGVGVITVVNNIPGPGVVATVTVQWRQPSETITRKYVAVANLNPSN